MIALLLLLAVVLPAKRVPAATNTVRSITLRECLERALTGNLELRSERLNPTIQSWVVTGAQGAFDPLLGGHSNYEESSVPGLPGSIDSRGWDVGGGLTGKLPTGTQYALTATDSRSWGDFGSNSVFAADTGLTLIQPLLRNFGLDPNLAAVRLARQGRAIADEQLRQRAIDTLTAVEQAYYELIFAIEDHRAALENLNRAQALLDENRKRVAVGVLSPLDVTQAESGVASREEAVIVTARTIKDNENVLKRLMSPDVAEWQGFTLVPADAAPIEMVDPDVNVHIRTALTARPDYAAAKHEIERQNITVRFTRNQLWPELDLTGSYGWNGLGFTGDQVGDTLGSGDYPAWKVGVSVTFPLGNRAARAAHQVARLQADQALISLKQIEQNIVVAIDDAVGRVQSNQKRVDATRVATRLAIESVAAEEARLRAGTSTSLQVLVAQAALANARSAEIRAQADYAQSLAELARVEGTSLARHRFTLETD